MRENLMENGEENAKQNCPPARCSPAQITWSLPTGPLDHAPQFLYQPV
jgi:hypothetical protein